MAKPTKEELLYCYCVLDMKQSEIEEKFSYKNISRLLTEYNIPKRPRGYYNKLSTEEVITKFKNFREDKGEFYDYSQVDYIRLFAS